ncbi:hypothetical protein [Natrinema hispanicum]|uniref:Uncharacterized protein n=1 Tax=Natrinema hispanicum TaxID=392421 RepID=A0A1G6IHJ9_9EURY|nr:hypothetical protein [Natrinema hispanicum]SDC06052.1 hypothetical protein SAMN05192552_1001268 [Natrinema hispanicum]
MRRLFIFATVAAVAIAIGTGVGPVAAQSNQTATNQTSGEPVAQAPDGSVQTIDNQTRIVDWSYEPGRFTLEIEADESTTISLTESGSFEEGTTSFNYAERDLDEGTQTVNFVVSPRQGEKGAAVAIATEKSLEQGTGAIVSSGMVQSNPFRHFGGQSGLFTGVIMTVALAALGAWYVVRSEENGVVEA